MHYTTPAILGGVEQVMGEHARGLREAGVAVTIVAGRGGLAPKGIGYERIRDVGSRAPIVERDRDALGDGRVTEEHAALVERLYRRLRPLVMRSDRVVAHNIFTMPFNLALTEALARLAAEGPGRFIAWIHDIASFDERYDRFKRPGMPWELLTRALPGVRYVTVSAQRADEWSGLSGLARDEIAVVPNGIDIPTVLGFSREGEALIDRLGLVDADPLLLLPARLTRRKRIEAAIDATKVLRSRGTNATLVVTGVVGPHDKQNLAYLEELKKRIAGATGVHLLAAEGITADFHVVVDLYALADVLVYPSEHEGFGIPILEAGMHRLPIVCSDIPVLREVGGDDPIFVPPDADGARIADAITKALDNRMTRMRRSARAHSWTRVLRDRVLPVILKNAS